MTTQDILVAGIGNIFLGDDGFGVEVMRQMMFEPAPEGVVFEDFGIRSIDLIYALVQPWRFVILVDAYDHDEVPGHLRVLRIRDEDIPLQPVVMDSHSLHPLSVLSAVKQQQGRIPPVMLVGCQPKTFGPEEGMLGLTDAVHAAIQPALTLIDTLVERERRVIRKGREAL